MKALPVVLQHDLMDCGAAVLLIVSKVFGVNTDYRWIRERLRVGPDGSTLEDLAEVAGDLGLAMQAVHLAKMQDLLHQEGIFILCGRPGLVQAGYGHYMVFKPLGAGFAEVSDPSCGVRRVSIGSFEGKFEPVALFFPESENREIDSAPRLCPPGPEVGRLFKAYRWAFFSIVALSFLGAALNVIPSMVFGKFVDSLQQRTIEAWYWVGLYLACLGLREFLGYVKNYRFLRLSQVFSYHFTGILIRRILRVSWQLFSSRRVGDYSGRLGALSEFQRFASDVLDSVFSRLVTLGLTCIALAVIDVRLMGIAIAVGAVALLVNTLSVRQKVSMGYQMDVAVAGNGSNIYELLLLKRWIANNSVYTYFFRRWSRLTKRLAKMNAKLAGFSFRWDSLSLWSAVLLEFGGVAWVLVLFERGELSAGQVVTAITLQTSLISLLSSFDGIQMSFRNAQLAFERIQDLFTESLPGASLSGKCSAATAIQNIELRGVSFGFKGERGRRVLDRFNLFLEKGKITVIRGTSGAGKSTVLGVLCGSYLPFGGELILDQGRAVPWESVSRLKLCSFVDQELQFFDGTIYENLVMGEVIPEGELYRLIDLAGLAEAVSQFSKGIHSEISDFARGLSGGQLQRIAVIRALVSRRPVIVLDEPTSSLDEFSERKIMDLLKSYRDSKVILISTHSELLASIADNTIVMGGSDD